MAKGEADKYKKLVDALRKQLQEIKIKDRRSFSRYRANAKVSIKRRDAKGAAAAIKAAAADISQCGMGVVDMPIKLKKGEVVDLVLVRKDRTIRVSSMAKVVRCHKTPKGYAVGMVFLKDLKA